MTTMTEEPIYTRADVVTIAGVDENTLIFWLRHGLLQWADRGSRKHRRFTRREVKLAALFWEARATGMNITAMLEIGRELRAALAAYDEFVKTVPDFWKGLDTLRREEAEAMRVAADFENGEAHLNVYRDAAGELRIDSRQYGDSPFPARSVLTFSFKLIFNLNWPEDPDGEDR